MSLHKYVSGDSRRTMTLKTHLRLQAQVSSGNRQRCEEAKGSLIKVAYQNFNSVSACDTCPASNFIRSVANNKPYYLTCAVREDFDVLTTQKALTDSTLGLGISVFHNPHERWPRNLAYNVPLRWLHRSSGIGKQLQTTISPLQKTIFGFQTQL